MDELKLEKMLVTEIDPDSRYLFVFTSEFSLSREELEYNRAQIRQILDDILGATPYQIMILNQGLKLEVFKVNPE